MKSHRFTYVACWSLLAGLALALTSTRAAEPDHVDAARRGWHFYQDPPTEADEEEAPPPSTARRSMPAPMQPAEQLPRRAELVEFEHLQKRLEELRNVSIMRPTEDNVRRYMELEAAVVRRASYFADVAQRVAWAHPELDMTLEGRPVNAQAIEVFDRRQMSERAASVKALSQDHVLLFFFRSDCPYCHAFAPTLAEFSARHGIAIVAISVDGRGLAEFPDFRVDNGIGRRLQVTTVPTVFLARPATGQIQPVGYGPLSESQLLERLAATQQPIAQEPEDVSSLADLASKFPAHLVGR